MEKYDTIIVGATAAYELSKKGFNVLALDKQKHPDTSPAEEACSSRNGG